MKKSNKVFWSGVAAGWGVMLIMLLSILRLSTGACASEVFGSMHDRGSVALSKPVGFGLCEYHDVILSRLNCYGPANLRNTTVIGETNVHGLLVIKGSTLHEVSVMGSLEMEDSNVYGPVDVTGPMEIKHSILHDKVNVRGVLHSIDSTIVGNLSLYGVLIANKARFGGNIIAHSDSLSFLDSSVMGNVTAASAQEKVVLTLSDGSKINGNIDVAVQPGVIQIDKTSKVGGVVHNGISNK